LESLYTLGLLGNYRETNVMGMDAFCKEDRKYSLPVFSSSCCRKNSPPFAKFEDALPYSREVLFILENQNWVAAWC